MGSSYINIDMGMGSKMQGKEFSLEAVSSKGVACCTGAKEEAVDRGTSLRIFPNFDGFSGYAFWTIFRENPESLQA